MDKEQQRLARLDDTYFSKEVGIPIFKMYIALLYRLCVEERNQYDLLIGPGDSGAVMIYFAELFYNAVGIPIPPKLILPVQRFKIDGDDKSGKYDNNSLAYLVKGQIPNKFSKALFIDDEIGQANSASQCAKLIADNLAESQMRNRILFTIVADNHGFEWHHDIPPIAIQYYSFSRKNKGKNNAALRLLSNEEQEQLNQFTQPYLNQFYKNEEQAKRDGQTKRMNLLFNSMIKVPSNSTDERPRFEDIPVEQFLDGGAHFIQFRSNIEDKIIALICEAVVEYKAGKIVPTF